MKSIYFKFLFLGLGVALFSSCGDDEDDTPAPPTTPNLAEVVSGDDRFTILLDALQRTGLDATLAGEGEFTVFTPTDSAFADLLAELGLADLDAVENALGNDGLKNVLLYHVLGAEVRASDVSTGYVTTLGENGNGNGLSAHIVVDGNVVINEKATVTQTDIDASNGVAHVIDKVILPLNVFDLVDVNPNLTALRSALVLADGDLDGVLSGSTNFTVFAPANAAFDTVIANTPNVNDLGELVAALGTDVLSTVLLYHVVPGEVREGDLSIGSVTTAAPNGMGGNLAFNVNINGSDVSISDLSPDTNDASVTETDITGTNGVVHTISSVLLPQ
jgi:transforming growth factor-beta-induced protein